MVDEGGLRIEFNTLWKNYDNTLENGLLQISGNSNVKNLCRILLKKHNLAKKKMNIRNPRAVFILIIAQHEKWERFPL